MNRTPRPRITFTLLATAIFAMASSARAGTLYVANEGVDGAACGSQDSPCRSITRGIANAVAGDKIVVGPGVYSNVNGEVGAPGCDCMLAINKAVSIESSNGAAQTKIDGRGFLVNRTVLAIATGGAFGKPGKGFLVTQSGGTNRAGMVIDADDFSIRGNQFTPLFGSNAGTAIEMVDSPGSIRFEGNQVLDWTAGIIMRGANKTVRGNVVMDNFVYGILTSAGSRIERNVVIGSIDGIVLRAGAATVKGNAVIANTWGITNAFQGGPGGAFFSGTITKNNILNNGICGLLNDGIVGLVADDNYWGAAAGPGPDPADDVCNSSGATTAVSAFAAQPFKVKPKIKP